MITSRLVAIKKLHSPFRKLPFTIVSMTSALSKNTATKQAVEGHDNRGRFTIGNKPVLGFHTNPERRSDGRWKKEDSLSYQYRRLLSMPLDEFDKFRPRTKTESIAYHRILDADQDNFATKGLALAATKEITDRIEGKPKQDLGLSVDESSTPLIKGFVIPTLPDGFIKIPDIN